MTVQNRQIVEVDNGKSARRMLNMEGDRTGFIKGMTTVLLPAGLFALESPKTAD